MTEYESFVLEMLGHCYLYYECDDPEISDAQYDKQYQKLLKMEVEQGFANLSSPTNCVGFDKRALKDFLRSIYRDQG